MSTLLVAVASFVGFLVAYHTYGRWLSRKLFQLDPRVKTPAEELRDDHDYVPTHKQVIFGHHFTSIAGTGPIVGPAIAVFWGWLPALLWVVFGSILIGAVHDLGALVVSLRNRGQTTGQIAGRMISPRTRLLFLLILFFSLSVVLAIFGLVIANIFTLYPASVLSVWIAMPIAMVVGYVVYKRKSGLLWPSLISLTLLFVAVYVGVYHLPLSFGGAWKPYSVLIWTAILMVYCFLASVLPVWLLLQPRDFVNSQQLVVSLALLVAGLFAAGLAGSANLFATTPAIVSAGDLPANAPPIFPFLFITVACGACSGFHCLVSSGTSSKQVAKEPDAQYVAYGSMLLEGALAVIVILACTAGVGMGTHQTNPATGQRELVVNAQGQPLAHAEAWRHRYPDKQAGGDWNKLQGLGPTVASFVEGGANFLGALGIPLALGMGLMATLVAGFAATTMDTATRLQRYVIQELAQTFRVPVLGDKFAATALAVLLGLAIALLPRTMVVEGKTTLVFGQGGLLLWPLFGATNQLLAGLAFMVTAFYLWRRNKPLLAVLAPMLFMLLMPAWAMLHNMVFQWWPAGDYHLFAFGGVITLLQGWMMVEGLIAWPRVQGVMEEALPPLRPALQPAATGGGD